ncbi:MAG: protein-L-isoaspartate(D-aspartate) O-methyltransferase [Sandaracinaceae bacterium]|nr:protein-L-isoaspartate(D-aspartate) O-methyltransferase [Sandaracinaceae bacterium]
MAATSFQDEVDFSQAREMMVRIHIEGRGIRNPAILNAFRTVPRECFVDPPLKSHAYEDVPLLIGWGQTISQPYVVAWMLELANPQPTDRLLEIGSGSGYTAAIASLLVEEVIGIERIPSLMLKATQRLKSLGFERVKIYCADGSVGWEEGAPYDIIIVSAGAPRVPEALVKQLAPGGRMVLPIGPKEGVQEMTRVTKLGGELLEESFGSVRFVPLIGREGYDEDESEGSDGR